MKAKGGPGSGRKPEGGMRVPAGGIRLPTPRVPRSGIRPSELFPHGRNPDGSARTPNDPKPASRPDNPKK